MGLRVDYSMAAKAEGTVWASGCGPMTKLRRMVRLQDDWRSQWHPAISFGILEKHGCVLDREGGRHSIYRNPANGRCAAVPRHREIKEATGADDLRSVGSAAGVATGCKLVLARFSVAPWVVREEHWRSQWHPAWRKCRWRLGVGFRSRFPAKDRRSGLGLRVDYSMATEAEGTVGASWCGPQMKLNRMVDLQSTGRASGTRR